MLSLGFFEIVIIAVVGLVVLGPEKLPHLMRKIAQFYRQIQGLKDDLQHQINTSIDPRDNTPTAPTSEQPKPLEIKDKSDK